MLEPPNPPAPPPVPEPAAPAPPTPPAPPAPPNPERLAERPSAFWDFTGAYDPRLQPPDLRTALLILLSDHPTSRDRLPEDLTNRGGGGWRPGADAVLAELDAVAAEGLVSVRETPEGALCELTERGTAQLVDLRANLVDVTRGLPGRAA
jgi:DNA-binding PadR family transcriptional regulator